LNIYFQNYGEVAIGEQFGGLQECVVQYDKFTGNSRGFAFVTFNLPEDRDFALNQTQGRHYIGTFINGEILNGKWTDVKEATPRELTRRSRVISFSPSEDEQTFGPNNIHHYAPQPLWTPEQQQCEMEQLEIQQQQQQQQMLQQQQQQQQQHILQQQLFLMQPQIIRFGDFQCVAFMGLDGIIQTTPATHVPC